MATVTVENAEVIKINSVGFGVKVLEKQTRDGQEFTQRFTLWFKEPSGLKEGDRVTVTGFLGAKVSEPWNDKVTNEERRSVELNINAPRLSASTAEEPF